jgi:hypothetical protein
MYSYRPSSVRPTHGTLASVSAPPIYLVEDKEKVEFFSPSSSVSFQSLCLTIIYQHFFNNVVNIF